MKDSKTRNRRVFVEKTGLVQVTEKNHSGYFGYNKGQSYGETRRWPGLIIMKNLKEIYGDLGLVKAFYALFSGCLRPWFRSQTIDWLRNLGLNEEE